MSFEITDEVQDTYRSGITEEIADATLLLQGGQFAEARDAFESIVGREPRCREAYANLAVTHLQLGDRDEAEALLQKTIAKFPRYVFPRANLARIRLHEGKPDEALDLLEPLQKARRFHPLEFQHFVLTFSDVLAAQSNYRGALVWLNVLRDTLPGTRGLWSRRIRYGIRRLFQGTKNHP